MDYILGTKKVKAQEDHLKTQNQIFATLKHNLTVAQKKMKSQADKEQTEKEFCLKILIFILHRSTQAQAWEKHCPLTHLTSY